MKCPECVVTGRMSTLRDEHGGYTTLLNYDMFYGEDGRFHIHDPNSFRGSMRCSNGHVLRVVRFSTGCTACDYKGGEDALEVIDARASR